MEHAKSKQLKLYTYLHKTTVSSMYMNILRFIQNQNIFTNKSNYKYKYVTTKENEVKHDIIIMAMQVWKTLVLPVFNSGIRAPNDCYKNYHKFGFTKEHLAKYAKHSMLWWRISVSFKQNSPTIQYKMQTPLHVVSFQAYTCGSTIWLSLELTDNVTTLVFQYMASTRLAFISLALSAQLVGFTNNGD